MKQPIALLALTFALNASAGCPTTVPTRMPEVPDGLSASAESMHNSRDAIQTYVESIENFLSCQGQKMDDSRFNQWVDRAVFAAANFNSELERYQMRSGVLVKN